MGLERDVPPRGSHVYPPLPDPLTSQAARRAAGPPDGCYLINYAPNNSFMRGNAYEGTLRLQSRQGRLSASGDLYQRVFLESGPDLAFAPSPDPKAGVPVFPIGSYRYYLRVTDVTEAEGGFDLTFEAHRFSAQEVTFLTGFKTNWLVEDVLTARMRREPLVSDDPFPPPEDFPLPDAFPSPEHFFAGMVSDRSGQTAGVLKMGRVSPFLRKATIEIDSVAGSEIPRDNQAGVSWETLYNGVGWDLTVLPSDSNVAKPGGPVWADADAHAAMQAWRDRSDLDAEWRYHILVVQLIKHTGGERGVMYDFSAGNPNKVAREGLLLSTHYVFPPDEARWGALKGLRAGPTVTFFRTAVHEMGHAMGLDHNETGSFIMRPTDGIANDAPAGTPFPGNIAWAYAPEDELRLCHWPDIVVRPGGLDLSEGARAPIAAP